MIVNGSYKVEDDGDFQGKQSFFSGCFRCNTVVRCFFRWSMSHRLKNVTRGRLDLHSRQVVVSLSINKPILKRKEQRFQDDRDDRSPNVLRTRCLYFGVSCVVGFYLWEKCNFLPVPHPGTTLGNQN